MLRRKLNAGGAENGVDAGGEDANLFRAAFESEIDFRAFAAADPVALHGAHFFRPAFELVQAVEQLIRVGGDAEEPLLEIALLDDGVFVTPAAAVDDLLVGEHGGALRAPVDLALLAVDQALLIHAQEEPLVPAIVVGQAGGDFRLPSRSRGRGAASGASWRRCWRASIRAGACCF